MFSATSPPRTVAEILIPLLAGLGAGMVLTIGLLRHTAWVRAEDRLDAWASRQSRQVRRQELSAGRAALKDLVGADVAAANTGASDDTDRGALPFLPADARFIGDPVTFVVFDGHTEVKDRAAPTLRAISFVSLAGLDRAPTAEAQLVAECLAEGHVDWLTVVLGSG